MMDDVNTDVWQYVYIGSKWFDKTTKIDHVIINEAVNSAH